MRESTKIKGYRTEMGEWHIIENIKNNFFRYERK